MPGSQATSQKCAPNEYIEYSLASGGSSVLACPSRALSFLRLKMFGKGTPLSGDSFSLWTRPPVIFSVLGSAFSKGEPAVSAATLITSAMAWSVAFTIAGMTVAVTADPPDVGPGG